MGNRNSVITTGAFFWIEAVLIFLIIVPFMHSYFQWIPYGSYFLIVGVLSLLFTIYSVYELRLWIFAFTGACLLVVFHQLDYPLFANAVLSIALTWRYLAVRDRGNDQPVFLYFVSTSLLILFIVFLVGDLRLLYLIPLQFMFILAVFLFKDFVGFEHIDFKAFLIFLSILLAGALSFLLLFTPFLGIWELLRTSIFFLLGRFVGLFQFLEGYQFELQGMEIAPQTEGRGEEISGEESSFLEPLTSFVVSYLGITTLILIGGVIFLIYLFRKRLGKFTYRRDKKQNLPITHSKFPVKPTFSLKRFVQKPKHPARKMVYQLEREMLKLEKGRQESETLEAWLRRLGLQTNLPIYQKVRYGEEHVSPEEIQQLQREIDLLREFVRKQA